MDFRPLNDTERRQLINALRGNAESDRAILMDRRDTSFLAWPRVLAERDIAPARHRDLQEPARGQRAPQRILKSAPHLASTQRAGSRQERVPAAGDLPKTPLVGAVRFHQNRDGTEDAWCSASATDGLWDRHHAGMG